MSHTSPAEAKAIATATTATKQSWYRLIFTRTMLTCVFTGFTSGLPLFFILQLLPAWLLSYGVSVKTIGAFSLTQLPYVLKFLWAPLLDRYSLLPAFGRRRSWMLVTAVLLGLVMSLYALLNPQIQMRWVVVVSIAAAFFSATFDVASDAFRREILSDQELGLGNSIHVNAYKIAGFVPGALSLILADHLPWSAVFMITALFVLPGVVMAWLVAEPATSRQAPRTLIGSVVEPFEEFFTRQGWKMALLILLFMLLYKLGDSMATALQSTFVLKMGFSKTDLGTINKGVGLASSIVGGIVAGIWMLRLGINKALWVFGVLQAVAILAFVALAHYGPFSEIGSNQRLLLAVVIAAEAFGMSLGTMAFVAFIARTTNPAYTALQFALFTSLTAVPRSFINASTGWLVERMGWESFFYLCMCLAVPGLLMLFKIAPWYGDDETLHPSSAQS